MNRYEVTLFKKDTLLEAVNSGFPDGDCMDKYCRTVEVDVPMYLIGVGAVDFLNSHLHSHGLIDEGWEMKDYRKVN